MSGRGSIFGLMDSSAARAWEVPVSSSASASSTALLVAMRTKALIVKLIAGLVTLARAREVWLARPRPLVVVFLVLESRED